MGAMILVSPEAVPNAGGGGNMPAPLLALVGGGGDAFLGFAEVRCGGHSYRQRSDCWR